jgi:hypothetical protein
MNFKYISCGILAFIMILGWNAFLIKRDDALYKSYYKMQAMENVKKVNKSMLNN